MLKNKYLLHKEKAVDLFLDLSLSLSLSLSLGLYIYIYIDYFHFKLCWDSSER